jgi:hypothetical protein
MICPNLKMLWNGIPRVFIYFLPRNGIPSCFLFRAMVRDGVCFYFSFTEQNSDQFFLPRKGTERNSESLLIILFHCMYRIQSIFSYNELVETEFREFSVMRNSRNSAGTNQLLHLFREIFFCRKLPTLKTTLCRS